MQVIIVTDSKLRASVRFWAQVLLHLILYPKGTSPQQIKDVQKLIVLHLQDHFRFSHVPKVAPLGVDIVSFCFRNHCVEGSSFLGVRNYLRSRTTSAPLPSQACRHQLLLGDGPLGRGRTCQGAVWRLPHAHAGGDFSPSFADTCLRLLVSQVLFKSLLRLHTCLGFGLVWFFLNAGAAVRVSGILDFFFLFTPLAAAPSFWWKGWFINVCLVDWAVRGGKKGPKLHTLLPSLCAWWYRLCRLSIMCWCVAPAGAVEVALDHQSPPRITLSVGVIILKAVALNILRELDERQMKVKFRWQCC